MDLLKAYVGAMLLLAGVLWAYLEGRRDGEAGCYVNGGVRGLLVTFAQVAMTVSGTLLWTMV